MDRGEAVKLLSNNANPDGSYLVRRNRRGDHVLSLKFFNTRPDNPEEYMFMHYHVRTNPEDGTVWFNNTKQKSHRKFFMLNDLVVICLANRMPGMRTKLTNICLIPVPHSDPDFPYYNENYDSLRVPVSEIVLGRQLGAGQFGNVYKGRFRGNLDVAVKELKVMEVRGDDDAAGRALEEFFNEVAVMKELHHPNLIQLFAYVRHSTEGNLMIQEYMANGDLKNYMKKMRENPDGTVANEPTMNTPELWRKLLTWCLDVARGMARLASLDIVHRDLAAR